MAAKEQEDMEKIGMHGRLWNGFCESLLYAVAGVAVGLCAKMFIEGFFGIH